MLQVIQDIVQWYRELPQFLQKAALAVLIVAAAILIVAFLRWLIDKTFRRRHKNAKRINTVRKLLRSIVTYVVVIMACVQIFQSVLGVNLGAIMAAAGILGVALGFGAQTLVKDIIAGFFILMEGQFSVGDKVTIPLPNASTFSGTVDELGLRATRVRSETGDLFILPNGSITCLVNHSLLPQSFSLECVFAREQDTAALLELFEQVGKKAEADIALLKKTPVASVFPVLDGGISIRLKVFCSLETEDFLIREVRHRLRKALHGVQLNENEPTILCDR